MKRIQVLIGKRRTMVIATLAILVLAAAALVASSASFSATSANPHNTFTAGNLHHVNENDGSAILSVSSKMKPGDVASGTVVITNDGDLDGTFSLKQSDVVPGAGDPAFASYLQLTITDQTAGKQVYTGSLNGLPAAGVALPSIAAGAAHTYAFEVEFPNGAVGKENQYMGTTAGCQFDWTQSQ